MTSVRVALDVGATYGRRTGIGNAVAWTLDALHERRSDEHAVELRPYVTSVRARVQPPVRRLPLPAALAHRWWPHPSPPLDRVLGRPDVVHGTNYVVPPARCARLVSVYDCWFLEHPELAAPDVARAAAVLRRSVADGATVLTCSTATAERVSALLGADLGEHGRVVTMLLGPPPAPHRAGAVDSVAGSARHSPIDTGGPFVLSLGTIERRKNIGLLVEAFDRLAAEHATVRLVLAGADGDDNDTVTAAITRLPTDRRRRVVRLGPVDAATKAWLLEHARALAYPSLDEGFGYPILEAQLAGTPVVATAVGSIPEVAGPAALLSPLGDADALAANLHWMITSDDMHARQARRGRANLERFSWGHYADQLAALYHRLSEEHTR